MLRYCCEVIHLKFFFSCNFGALYSHPHINCSDEDSDVVDSVKRPWSNFIFIVQAQWDTSSCQFTCLLPGNVDFDYDWHCLIIVFVFCLH